MFSEFRKSINSILYERIASPLYGAFFFSWIVCNWKIVYVTLFVSESRLGENKVDYIVANYLDIWNLLWIPLISTAIIISGIAWLSNQVYKLSLYFEEKRREWKEEKQKSHRLTVEQSMEIRNEIADQNLRFDKQIQEKNKEKKLLSDQVERLTEELTVRDKRENELKVVVAFYGHSQHHVEVTEKINSLISTDENKLYFHVDNRTLVEDKNDPFPGRLKDLIMTYRYLGKYKLVLATEGAIIEIKNGVLSLISDGRSHRISSTGIGSMFNKAGDGVDHG